MDFGSLQSAMNDVRKHQGRSRDSVQQTEVQKPLRSRHPVFRWRLIPAICCAVESTMFFAGRTYQILTGGPSATNTTWLIADLLIAFFLGSAAIAWMRNRWLIAILLMVAAITVQPLLVF